MAKRRTTLLLAASISLAIVLGAGLYAGYQWQAFKREQGIAALEIQGWRLSADGLFLQHISLIRQTTEERLTLIVDDLRLSPDTWSRPLPLRSLHINQLQVDWQRAAQPDLPSGDETPPTQYRN